MDFRQLNYFVQIAETGNVRRAASRLRVAQSALSRHVKALERELGVRLFDRHPHGMSVTNAGARLLDRAKHLLEEIEAVRSEIMAEGDRLSGRVCFGTTGTMSRILFGRLAERLKTESPGITTDLIEGRTYLLLEGLDTRKIDLALMSGAEPRSNVAIEPLVTDQLYLIGAATDSRAATGEINFAALQNFPLIMFKRPSGPRMTLEREAERARISLTFSYEVDSFDVIKSFVARNLGYGVVPHSSIYEDLNRGTFKAARIRGLTLERMLVRRTDRPAAPVVDEIARMIRLEMAIMRAEGVFTRDRPNRPASCRPDAALPGHDQTANAMAHPVPAGER